MPKTKTYNINDYILTSRINKSYLFTNKYKGTFEKEKYVVQKAITLHDSRYYKGDIIISENVVPNSEIKHAFSYHIVQGLTIKDVNINLDLENIFYQKRMLYVAISRAQYISQLHIY